ncbi:MAG TPA: Ldh family oxidoreductase [Candidatus Rifleibacterium sp.]|nr:Ldh family oxidoreductase [Candidatus Rifleibacterium sp.]HPT47526.1 Ldh family oxidoreductase [Candidatus Rifleibacterium sp.]
MIFLNSEPARKLVIETLNNAGHVEEGSKHVADSLISTSLRGVDSHGLNLFPHYIRALAAKRVNASPKFKIVKTAESVIQFDADHAFGHYCGAKAMQEAILTARKTGVGIASVRNSTHFGAAAYFGLMAAENGLIGLAFTNADALVKVHGSKEPFFGTNPICFTAPLANEGPFCLDMATSRIAWNKVVLYRKSKKVLEKDWAYNKEGEMVLSPDEASTLNPIGDYKGYGLGFVIDILCGILAEGPVGKEILPMYRAPIEARRKIGHFFAAINIEAFTGIQNFKTRMQGIVDQLRHLQPISSSNPVLVAGDPEKHSEEKRKINGIPMEDEMFQEFLQINQKFQSAVLRHE